jgi:hypothetical protein
MTNLISPRLRVLASRTVDPWLGPAVADLAQQGPADVPVQSAQGFEIRDSHRLLQRNYSILPLANATLTHRLAGPAERRDRPRNGQSAGWP